MKSTPPPGHQIFAPWGETFHCWNQGEVQPDRDTTLWDEKTKKPVAARLLGGPSTCLKRHGHRDPCEWTVDCQPNGINPPADGKPVKVFVDAPA